MPERPALMAWLMAVVAVEMSEGSTGTVFLQIVMDSDFKLTNGLTSGREPK
jgi:hypothetical protein